MIDALKTPQPILRLGGTSEIGLAIDRRLLPADRVIKVALAGRDLDALESAGRALPVDLVTVRPLAFDAADRSAHETVVAQAWVSGDVDVVIVAFGILGEQPVLVRGPAAGARLADANFTGAVSVSLHVAHRMREQGHGHLIALSSNVAERARPSNFIYGASKAGLDAFLDGLGCELGDDGITVNDLRPGFVRTRMTAGHNVPPLASGPDDVFAAAVGRLGHTGAAYVSTLHRLLEVALRVLARFIVRRLP